MTQYLLKFKALRILLYVVAPLLVTRGLMLLWQQKILSGVESLGGMFDRTRRSLHSLWMVSCRTCVEGDMGFNWQQD